MFRPSDKNTMFLTRAWLAEANLGNIIGQSPKNEEYLSKYRSMYVGYWNCSGHSLRIASWSRSDWFTAACTGCRLKLTLIWCAGGGSGRTCFGSPSTPLPGYWGRRRRSCVLRVFVITATTSGTAAPSSGDGGQHWYRTGAIVSTTWWRQHGKRHCWRNAVWRECQWVVPPTVRGSVSGNVQGGRRWRRRAWWGWRCVRKRQ